MKYKETLASRVVPYIYSTVDAGKEIVKLPLCPIKQELYFTILLHKLKNLYKDLYKIMPFALKLISNLKGNSPILYNFSLQIHKFVKQSQESLVSIKAL